ncbi:endonuclease [Sungkyunkwania multivorans]|uniref:Endonuclease n=1 Tax=Sungkyunkwania multivorans TaxID=1173618 RepID=A0ABW3CZT8_9FLAO
MKRLLSLLFLVVGLFSYAQDGAPDDYYNDVNLTLTGTALRDELATKITSTHTNFLSYSEIWDVSRITDEDATNTSNVVLLYGWEAGSDSDCTNDRSRSKTLNGGNACDWNREHSYPRSLGNPDLGSSGPGSDAHHLRPTDVQRNGSRGSQLFASGSGNSGNVSGGWYPGDEWIGDVARMMMYMYLRYGSQCLPSNVAVGSNNTVDSNMIDLLLDWNAADPVSPLEDARNTYHDSTGIYAQGNRNPFIDNPYLATQIWGGTPAQDRWNTGGGDTEAPTIPTNLIVSNETSSSLDLSWTASTDNVGVNEYEVYVDSVLDQTVMTTTATISGLSASTTYSLTVLAKDAAGNMSAQSAAVNGTTLMGGGGNSCGGGVSISETFINIPDSGSGYGTRNWTGDDGGSWTATDARTDQTIDGKAITIRNGSLTAPQSTEGIGNLTVTTQRVFSGGSGTFDVEVNGSVVGTVAYSDVEQTVSINDINIEGNVIVVFTGKAATGDRVKIDNLSWTCYSAPTNISLSPKVFLEGAMINETTLMRDDLRAATVIPTTSPYIDAATTIAATFDQGGASGIGLAQDDIVDWVWVELRDATNNALVVDGQSALLQRDGDIVSTDGSAPMSFMQSAGNYYIFVQHRNHLGILSTNTYALSSATTTIDLATNASDVVGNTNAVVLLSNGSYGMITGDNDGNGQVQNTDVSSLRPQVGTAGYNNADLDMNGQTQLTDINNALRPNIGKGEQN